MIEPTPIRIAYQLFGQLQGVGFRPFAYRLAQVMDLSGWVKNTRTGVKLEVQGMDFKLQEFETRLVRELPQNAHIRSYQKESVVLEFDRNFQILPSESDGMSTAEFLPDLAVCKNCISDFLDPSNRRYLYSFTNCTDCGPRYSILKKLPYDRINTTMSSFSMCDACLIEYQDPLQRRFHSQANCCPRCGPTLVLQDLKGRNRIIENLAILATAEHIRSGAIIVVKGLGGFHFVCDSQKDDAIHKLRLFKQRPSKPFALMVRDIQQAHRLCEISSLEESFLQSRGAPIVLLKASHDPRLTVSKSIAPGLGYLGLMLPYTPMHYLLMNELEYPLVVTSGNISDEPICYEMRDALDQFGGIADQILTHDRQIACAIDDSVVREIARTEVVLRAGRGYAPLVLESGSTSQKNRLIGLGAHQKSTIALGEESGKIILMPHIGDLGTVKSMNIYKNSVQNLAQLNLFPDTKMICDYHPDYFSTRIAQELTPQWIPIQHHMAHVYSCVAEHQIEGDILGVAWDGTGWGGDGSIWGGEFLKRIQGKWAHAGSFRSFRLLGGAAAIREPRRVAFSLLFEIFGEACFQKVQALGFSEQEMRIFIKALAQGVNSPQTRSVGRLFDGVGAFIGLRSIAEYEGQTALELESAVEQDLPIATYPVLIQDKISFIVDWEPWILGILEDIGQGLSLHRIASQFHQTLSLSILEVARRVGIAQVVLTGGCFQNRVLGERTISMLKKEGFFPYWNQKVPPNDAGISVGQVMGGWDVLISSG